jgi:hypothetical protein
LDVSDIGGRNLVFYQSPNRAAIVGSGKQEMGSRRRGCLKSREVTIITARRIGKNATFYQLTIIFIRGSACVPESIICLVTKKRKLKQKIDKIMNWICNENMQGSYLSVLL